VPTYDKTNRFLHDFENLTHEEAGRFLEVLDDFVEAIREGPPYPGNLRMKKVQGWKGVWEMSFANDGRATFEFGEQIHAGEAHIVWRRIGGHEIFRNP
jgi:mRNA-degrading endonuclease YafQ of YafQ-DinJ toxin-antitoxin module